MARASDSLRCLVVDDHPLVRQGIRALVEREFAQAEVQDVPNLQAALELNGGTRPDVVVLDPRDRSGEVNQVVNELHQRLRSPIVIFTSDGGARALSDALKAGVRGYVRKDSPPEDLVRAIEAAVSDEFYVDPALSSSIVLEEGERTLTARQRQILQMLANGMHTDAVARELNLSTETVRTHTKRILAKLRAETRTQAVAIAIRGGLID